DPLLLARAEVLGRDVEDPVGVDVEGHLDLGHPPRRRRDPLQPEAAEGHVVPGHRALALEHVDVDRPRAVLRRGGDLRLAGGGGVGGGGGWGGLRPIPPSPPPPRVSTPRVRGVTSSRTTSLTSPVSTAAWMAAPTATTSSGLTPWLGSLPVSFFTSCWITGIR